MVVQEGFYSRDLVSVAALGEANAPSRRTGAVGVHMLIRVIEEL